MEQKYVCASICDRLPTLSANHPWLVDQNIEAEEHDSRDYIIYTIRDPLSQYRYQIPSFLGKHIRGCFYGWVILSNHPHNDMWSLWNPVASKIIRLPRLTFKNGDRCSNVIQQCCLSSPPDEPGSVFMGTAENYTIVFCRLNCKRKKLKWVKMSYAKQMRSITGHDSFLYSLTSCNGKVYAFATVVRGKLSLIHIDIVVKGTEIVISLLPYLELPYHYMNGCMIATRFLIGCCTDLFYIKLGFNEVGYVTKETVGAVIVFKLDMTNARWEEIEDLEDDGFFLDLVHDSSAFYSARVSSEQGGGGYVHFLDRSGKVIHSYDLKTKTITLSSMPTSNASLLELRLQGGHVEVKCGDDARREDDKENEMVVSSVRHGNVGNVDSNSRGIEADEENTDPRLPFDLLEMIMGFCVGIEFLNFRATCRQCRLAAPLIRWDNRIALGRLDTYSLVSPWLLVLDQEEDIISFIDPLLGDGYFMKTPRELFGDLEIHCSMYGWLLIQGHNGNAQTVEDLLRPVLPLCFFNPFTGDIVKLPTPPYLQSYCFTAPPTSSDCMVVGFTTLGEWHVYIHFVDQDTSWRRFPLNFNGVCRHSFHFATCYGRDVYAVYNNGGVGFFNTDSQDYTWQEGPRSSCVSPKQNFLTKCGQHLLLVIVAEFGESVEVFRLNDSTEWERTTSLGRHAIYICDETCLCSEAKIPGMANKIYFSRLHCGNEKIVFYSLETGRYHTFNGGNMEESFGDFMGTKHHLNHHVWIEPSWAWW